MSQKDGIDVKVHRFLIRGEGNIKYIYNNGVMVKEPETASMNFLKALEKLPGYIEQEQKKIKELKKDLPVLQEIVNGIWNKENSLSELKTELAAVERKIMLSISSESKDESKGQLEIQTETSIRAQPKLRPFG